MNERQGRLLEVFVTLLDDHDKDFEGYVRDIEDVRYCNTPIDSQQLARCEYALRNMDLQLLTINSCLQIIRLDASVRETVVDTKNRWQISKERVDAHLSDIRKIVDRNAALLAPIAHKLA